MSNIYIVEPPTNGKVLLKTSVGDIDLELWSKEAPKACRNFIQLCLEGYYNGTIFHRVVKGFIIQGGDPTGSGTGGDSIYGHPFKDEFHSRLRFSRRGLLAMANAGRDDNASQFFFTLAATPELQNKHTIFGKVSGETIFNMLKLEDALVDEDERPMYPQQVVKTEVLYNPFTDIVPRNQPPATESNTTSDRKRKKEKSGGVKNFKLLSFGAEAEEDEEETEVANKMYSGRSKSTHDVLQDPSLSSEPALGDVPDDPPHRDQDADREELSRIRSKLKIEKLKEHSDKKEDKVEVEAEEPYVLGQARRDERKQMAENIRKEIRDLKRGIKSDSKQKTQPEEASKSMKEKEMSGSSSNSTHIHEYEEEQKKYKEQQSKLPKKGSSREAFTLALLSKFKEKLASAKEKSETEAEKPEEAAGSDDDNWMSHKLQFEDFTPVVARDASTKGDDWFDITDPRNPINKRRREDGKSKGSSSRERRKR